MQTIADVSTAVPFLDLTHAHEALKEGVLAEFSSLIDSNAFTNGPQVAAFERDFAAYCDARTCVGVASGLDALRLALLALGAAPEDEVIVPANTFVATLEAVTQARCRPVLVDASEDDLNIDVDAAGAAVTLRTRFILPVHLYGQLADMPSITELARRTSSLVVEDACQAHGATRDGVRAGSAGAAAAFSFYPGKNLGAFGDAGALTTDDEGVAASVRALREHGQTQKYHHEMEGWTSRLDTIQAIVLRAKLPLLDKWNRQRRDAAAFYSAELADLGDLVLAPVPVGSEPVWHLYTVRTLRRNALADHLRSVGVATGLHYPEPAHLAPAYRWLGYTEGSFPVAERLAAEVLSLPMFPGITEAQLETVVAGIRAFFSRGQ
jgi:dTDP-4-amino-4,6-dideoxygalactose transaminase